MQRLNTLAPTFCPLVEQIVADCPILDCFSDTYLVDSFPCVIANAKRSGKARVARQIASKGWCASKNMWYYGVKVHIVAKQAHKGLNPIISVSQAQQTMTPASALALSPWHSLWR